MFLKRCLIVTAALALFLIVQTFAAENCEPLDPEYNMFEPDDEDEPCIPVINSNVENITSLRAKLENSPGCGTDMKCVAYYLCSENGTVVVDGSFLIDERFDNDGAPAEEVPVCPAMEYCCEKNEIKVAGVESKCKSHKPPAKCGFRNAKGLGNPVKSIQGITQYAHYAEFPWLMAVSNESAFLGGGALIHERVVLTAAHIFKHSKGMKYKVRGGEYNTQTQEEMCPHVDMNGKKLIIHEEFKPQNLQNDVALLILEKPFQLTATINTICLPPADMVFDRKKCVSSGWGRTNFDVTERHQVFPKVVNLPVVSHEECQEMFRNTRLGEDFLLHESFLCAGGEEGIDACTGDGGSPLVCESQTKGNYYVAGVVAGGLSCGKKDIPGFYVNVAYFRDWIDGKLGTLSFFGATLN